MENSPTIVEDDSETTAEDKTSSERQEKQERRDKSRKRRSLGSAAILESKPAVKSVAESGIAEVKPAPETEAPTESIGEKEKLVIERELVISAQKFDAEQASEAGATSEPEVVAGDQAVENFRELIVVNNKSSDEALQETLENIGVEATAESEPKPKPEYAPEYESEPDSDPELTPDPETEAAPQPHPETTIETEPEVEDDAKDPPKPPPPTSPPSYRPPQPPFRPPSRPPVGPPSGPPQRPTGPNFNNPNPPNFIPSAKKYEEMPDSERFRQANPAAMALFGGIIGYLIGRRRGRIKTEKKLLPIQKKLENQVNDLEWQISEKEAKIRKAAGDRVRLSNSLIIETAANKLRGAEHVSEHIGHVVVASTETDTKPAKLEKPAVEPLANGADKKTEAKIGKRIDTLSRAELLAASEKIVIDGSSLRNVYETHLIGERGLRRLVAEHSGGGDLKKALRQEVVEREIDFERDPALRDLAIQQMPEGGGKNAQLEKLLEKVTVSGVDGREEAAFFKARAAYEAQNHHRQQRRQKIVDISFVGAIGLLIMFAGALYLMRG